MTTTLDNERFFVEYSDGRGRWEPFTMYWNINDKHITRFWKAKLLENYIGINNRTKYALLDKRYMNRGFLNSKDGEYSRDIQAVCDEVNNAIQILNIEYSQISDYPKIDLKFTPERCWNEEFFRDDFNQLHHHFERLIGQIWNLSTHYQQMTRKCQWAVHCLNNACHEIESLIHGVIEIDKWEAKKHLAPQHRHFNERYGWCGISFNTPNFDGILHGEKKYFDYDEEHFNDWETKTISWGTLIPYYSQLGKNLREVWHDGDEYIDDGNISSHCLMTGECNVCLTGPGIDDKPMIDWIPGEKEFAKWLEERGFDYEDPKVGAGYAVMGKPAFELFPDDTWQTLDDKIKRCDNITAIGFCDRSLNVCETRSYRYDYTWQEQYKAECKMFKQNKWENTAMHKIKTNKGWHG